MRLIHLIRHDEPTVSGVMLGLLDPPLLALPAKSTLQVRAVFSSPLRRAHETARSLFPDHTIVMLDNLKEISWGEWDGLSWDEIERRDPELAARKLADWFGVTAPGGESHAAILERAADAVRSIRRSKGTIAVVAHQGIHAVVWQLLTGEPAESFKQEYLEVKTHECDD